jgi:HprK-related kinase B
MAVNVSAYFIAFTTWRLILKRATGVLMGLQPGSAYAQGILLTNLNQVVNLINAAYAKRVLRRGHVALPFVGGDLERLGRRSCRGPGAGKSSSALHLVEDSFRFLSADRVLALAGSDQVEVLGYPKQPRVN